MDGWGSAHSEPVEGRERLGVAMEHRINRLLLIKSVLPHTGDICWVPPGGGLEGDESIFDCAVREAFEEAGIYVELDRIVYLRQFIDKGFGVPNFEVFVLAAPSPVRSP